VDVGDNRDPSMQKLLDRAQYLLRTPAVRFEYSSGRLAKVTDQVVPTTAFTAPGGIEPPPDNQGRKTTMNTAAVPVESAPTEDLDHPVSMLGSPEGSAPSCRSRRLPCPRCRRSTLQYRSQSYRYLFDLIRDDRCSDRLIVHVDRTEMKVMQYEVMPYPRDRSGMIRG
jgi:hypothetical protein